MEAVDAYRTSHAAATRRQDTERAALGLTEGVAAARRPVDGLFAALSRFLRDHVDRPDGGTLQLLMTAGIRAQPDWPDLEVLAENAGNTLGRGRPARRPPLSLLDDLKEAGLLNYDELRADLLSKSESLEELQERLTQLFLRPDPGTVYWMEEGGGGMSLHGAPLQVGPILKERLFDAKRSVVLTSATLSGQGGYAQTKERLGVEDADEVLLGSPFDYKRAALVCVPQDLPEPTAPVLRRGCRQGRGRPGPHRPGPHHGPVHLPRRPPRRGKPGASRPGGRGHPRPRAGRQRARLDACWRSSWRTPRPSSWALPASGRAWTSRERCCGCWCWPGSHSTSPRSRCSPPAPSSTRVPSPSNALPQAILRFGRGSAGSSAPAPTAASWSSSTVASRRAPTATSSCVRSPAALSPADAGAAARGRRPVVGGLGCACSLTSRWTSPRPSTAGRSSAGDGKKAGGTASSTATPSSCDGGATASSTARRSGRPGPSRPCCGASSGLTTTSPPSRTS